MFEEYTYEKLLADALDAAPDGIDTRQGSIFYDAISGILNDIAKLYTDLDLVFELVFIDTTSGEYLDLKASEYGITRLAATKSKYVINYTGTAPSVGTRFFSDGIYFVTKKDDDGTLYLEAEQAGTDSNYITSGTTAVPVNTVQGMTSAQFGSVIDSGTDTEDDDSLRVRVKEKIAGPAENGNKQHYKTWCESIDGVGRARIFPLWNGPNTVKGVLINANGTPCGPTVVSEVQDYIDPDALGQTVTIDGKTYNVGDGLGEGVANLGAHFTAVAADGLPVDLDFTAVISNTYTPETAKTAVETAIDNYFKTLVLDTAEDDTIVIRITAVGAILSGLDCIVDYSDLTLNGTQANITPTDDEVPIRGEVTIIVE